MNISNICVIGEDDRMDYVALKLYTLGFDVYREERYINNKSMIVLSPPANEAMTRRIIPYLEYGQILYSGAMSNRLKHQCELMKIEYVDYLMIDELTTINAKLTAKGIIKNAIKNNAVLEKSNCLVTGFGFCGKAIAELLTNDKIDANVDVMVRRRELKPVIENAGFGFVDMNDTSVNFEKYSYVFNTVPALIINDTMIDKLSKNVMIFDIASGEGGVDFKYCEEKDIFAIQCLGIPGKEYPQEAGNAIADTIINDINLK
ncbi:MAG: hypothetical protein IJ167_12370 [Lachnospiraceae bacterium]|nr:hypothetical protein [Lachnospiraceae bacterium]MBQ9608749.1 hypothetical protein [Lachnospiraceae bacterium]